VHTHSIISAILIGLLLGALGRLLVPGRQAMGMITTLLTGLVAAFAGGWLGDHINGGRSFLLTLVLQIVLAVILTALVGGYARGRTGAH
jgi:uncharacterized membrane protein YeaQ/YmgE (transglycosylase-associated protein family)